MNTASSMAVLVLGAGCSTRFKGGDKLGQCLIGKPVAHHVLAALRPFDWGQKILICRSSSEWTKAYRTEGYRIVENDDTRAGMLGSVHRGLAEVIQQQWVLICLADMPLVTAQHIERLLCRFSQHPDCDVATQGASVRSPPAILSVARLKLLPKTGAQGARSLLGKAHGVIAPDRLSQDVDTIADLQRAAAQLRSTEA